MNVASARRPWWRTLGPGLLVTAAFIGPGTVTTASRAGAEFGYALLWTLLFAVAATVVLQEMAARLGLVARLGLAAAIRETVSPAPARWLALTLVLTAVVLGNTAYQTGNLTGAALGLSLLTGWSPTACAILLGGTVIGLLLLGAAGGRLQTMLIAMVVLMSGAFLATAILVRPHWSGAVRALCTFQLPEGAWLTAMALVGTTVVPYNLFLHATAVQQKWSAAIPIERALHEARWDTALSISLGGLVTMSIITTAAAAFFQQSRSLDAAGQMATQLAPLVGPAAKSLFALGMLAAGVTSAITAPLAAGYAVAGAINRQQSSENRITTVVALSIALLGTLLAATFGKSPQATIVAAQAANGLLLPLVALFLLIVMNRRSLLGERRNGLWANLLGALVFVVVTGLGTLAILKLV